MAAILNSSLFNCAILDLAILHKTLTQTNSIWLTKWWQPSWILLSWIQPCCTKLWFNLIQSDSNSFILTQLDDGSHLGFSHLHKKNFTHAFSLNLMMAAILNSAILDSAILHKKVHFFILTQLDDGRYLEFCHIGFRHYYLGFSHVVQNSDSI